MSFTIETERLVLRPLQASDAPFIQENFSQPDVIPNLPPEVPNPYPADGAEFYLNNIMLPAIKAGKAIEFLVSRKEDGAPIGAVMIDEKNAETGEWRRGFWLAAPYRGKGYMDEAALAALNWVFANTPAKVVITGNAVSNKASSRIQQKHGFLPLGIRVQMPPFHNGETEYEAWEMPKEHFQKIHGKKA